VSFSFPFHSIERLSDALTSAAGSLIEAPAILYLQDYCIGEISFRPISLSDKHIAIWNVFENKNRAAASPVAALQHPAVFIFRS
jgi:hypothetical protein